jgi:hypothetical protein
MPDRFVTNFLWPVMLFGFRNMYLLKLVVPTKTWTKAFIIALFIIALFIMAKKLKPKHQLKVDKGY